MKARLKKHWFLVGMALIWGLGFVFPALSKAYQRSGLVDWAIALVMFCGGLTLETARILEQARNWRALALSAVMMFLLAPLIVLAGTAPLQLLHSELARQLFVGFMILAAQSCTLGSGIVISTAARGNVPLALVVTIFNSMLAALMTPMILGVTLGVHTGFDVIGMMGRLALIILLPVVVGQGLRPLLRTPLRSVGWLPSILTQLVILSLIFMSVGSAADWMRRSPGLVLALLAATLVLHALILAANYAVSRLATRDVACRRSLAICSSQKTLATGSYVWSKYFSSNPLGGIPLMFYHVVQLVFDSLLAHWLAARDERASAPPTLELLEKAEAEQG